LYSCSFVRPFGRFVPERQPPRRLALWHEPAERADEGAAVQRGQEAEGPGPLEDEQAAAPAGGRRQEV